MFTFDRVWLILCSNGGYQAPPSPTTHSLDGRVAGLKNTPRELQPRMAIVFFAFRIMYCDFADPFGPGL